MIPLHRAALTHLAPSECGGREFCFSIAPEGGARSYVLGAVSDQDRADWIAFLVAFGDFRSLTETGEAEAEQSRSRRDRQKLSMFVSSSRSDERIKLSAVVSFMSHFALRAPTGAAADVGLSSHSFDASAADSSAPFDSRKSQLAMARRGQPSLCSPVRPVFTPPEFSTWRLVPRSLREGYLMKRGSVSSFRASLSPSVAFLLLLLLLLLPFSFLFYFLSFIPPLLFVCSFH